MPSAFAVYTLGCMVSGCDKHALLYFGPVNSTVQNCVHMFDGHIPVVFTGETKNTAHACKFYWNQASKHVYTGLNCNNYWALLLLSPVVFTVMFNSKKYCHLRRKN